MTMVRQVAKALYENSGLTYSTQKYWDDLAKVAIGAMRELTDEMLAVAAASADDCSRSCCEQIYSEMIDAALKE